MNNTIHQTERYWKRVVLPSVARNALKGVLLIGAEEIKININEICDLIRDDNYVDFNHIKKYCKEGTWLEFLKVWEQKKRSKWMCSTSQKVLTKNTDLLVCERWLKWCHLSSTNLKKIPKLRNWYCKLCRGKYRDGWPFLQF